MEQDRRNRDRRQERTLAVDEVRSIIHEELRDHASLAKNGETWLQWLQRNITPERILLTAMFLVTIGARAQRVESVSTEALATAKAATETIMRMSGEQEAMRKIIDVQAEALSVSTKTYATKTDLAGIRDQISRITTRPEMAAALRGDLIPRLTRIEQHLAMKP